MVIHCIMSDNEDFSHSAYEWPSPFRSDIRCVDLPLDVYNLNDIRSANNRLRMLREFMHIVQIRENAVPSYISDPGPTSYKRRDLIHVKTYPTFDVDTIKKFKLPFDGFIDTCIVAGWTQYLDKWKNSNIVFNYTTDGVDRVIKYGYPKSLDWLKNNGFQIKFTHESLIYAMQVDRINVIAWFIKNKIPFMSMHVEFLINQGSFPYGMTKILKDYLNGEYLESRIMINMILNLYENGSLKNIIDGFNKITT